MGPVGPSLHAQGGSERPARPSPSTYILPALRFPMKMQLPALGQKPLSPPAAAAAPGSQRGRGWTGGRRNFLSWLPGRLTALTLPFFLSTLPCEVNRENSGCFHPAFKGVEEGESPPSLAASPAAPFLSSSSPAPTRKALKMSASPSPAALG